MVSAMIQSLFEKVVANLKSTVRYMKNLKTKLYSTVGISESYASVPRPVPGTTDAQLNSKEP